MSQEIRVQIYGQTYTVSGTLDAHYVDRLARLVDARLRALAAQTDTLDTRRLAVLAALNFADELEQLKEKFAAERSALPREFAARVEECTRQLAGALGEKPAG